jgi:hypothetical protein
MQGLEFKCPFDLKIIPSDGQISEGPVPQKKKLKVVTQDEMWVRNLDIPREHKQPSGRTAHEIPCAQNRGIVL